MTEKERQATDSIKKRDKLEELLIAEKGLEKVLKSIKAYIQVLKNKDCIRGKHFGGKPLDPLKEKNNLEVMLVAEAGLERTLKKIRSHIELRRAVDNEKRKRNEKDTV